MTPSSGPDPAGGAYARRQLAGPLALLRWSHGSRFRTARALAAPFAGRPLLDYGCGDGTFVADVHADFPRAVGAEIDEALVADCTARYAGAAGLSFVHVRDLDGVPDGAFGLVTCMEVLEHCTPEAAERVIADLRRLTAPDGAAIVSVPIETGPPLVGKQLYRALAARRGLEGYRDRERYRAGEMVRMVLAGRKTAIPRPVYETRLPSGEPNRYHGHKGFNWRAMRTRLDAAFRIDRVRYSPMPALGPLLNSQAWFVCRPR